MLAIAVLPLLALAAPVLGTPFRYPSSIVRRAAATCPADLPQSCVNGASPANVDSCCTITPGGQILQTQFWDTNPVTGPTNSWTIHGLWPDHCDGTYDAVCDSTRQYTNIREILQNGGAQATLDYMNTYWKDYQGNDESFWAHEWGKHGTCISTLDVACYGADYVAMEEVVQYFERAVAQFKTLPTYDWLAAAGIVPSTTVTYTLAQLQAVAVANFGYEAIWECASGNSLDEVWWGYTVQGPVQTGVFTPAGPDGSKSSCPETGIRYLPKVATTTSSGTPTSTTSGASSTSTGGLSAPSGKVFWNVYQLATAPTLKRSLPEQTPAPKFFNPVQRLKKRAVTIQDPEVAKRQFDPRNPTKRDSCTGPLPSGVCQQTCPTNFTPQTDGTCLCLAPYVESGDVCVLESYNAGGSANGFMISGGKWYSPSGTPAGYTITNIDAETFTMKTSKGPCAVASGVFSCATANTASTFSVDTDGNLVYGGSSNWYAPTVPTGSAQITVTTTVDAIPIKIRYGPSS